MSMTREQSIEEYDVIIQNYRYAMDSPAWTTIILPFLVERKRVLTAALTRAAQDDKPAETLRRIGASLAEVSWLAESMPSAIEGYDFERQREAKEVAGQIQVDADLQNVVQYGRSNPYVITPEYGQPVDDTEY